MPLSPHSDRGGGGVTGRICTECYVGHCWACVDRVDAPGMPVHRWGCECRHGGTEYQTALVGAMRIRRLYEIGDAR